MTDRSDIQVIVFDGRGINAILAQWLQGWPHVWYASQFIEDQRVHIAIQRNTAAQRFLDHGECAWLLMIDDDMVPRDGVEEVLGSPAGVTGTWCWGEVGQVHAPDGEAGCGFLKVSRAALQAIGEDPFTIEPEDVCECGAFSRRAREAGFWPRKVGVCGHAMWAIVEATPDGKRYAVKFPKEPKPFFGRPIGLPHKQ